MAISNDSLLDLSDSVTSVKKILPNSALEDRQNIYANGGKTSPSSARWPAFLQLAFDANDTGTRLVNRRHRGPLYVQKPFYPEGAEIAHVYLLHPPGGIVSGDTLSVDIGLDKRAKVVVTTPGATRFYRARKEDGDRQALAQRSLNRLSARNGSCLEWLPCETIVFDGAQIELRTQISLDDSSNFIGWEIVCLGLPVSRSPFSSGKFRQRFEVCVNEQPKIIETLIFDADSPLRNARCGFQSKPVFGTFIAGPHFLADVDLIVAQLREQMDKRLDEANNTSSIAASTYNGFIVLRFLGDCADRAKKDFIQAWEILRPFALNKSAVAPRIWST